jgi:hypothetical protein
MVGIEGDGLDVGLLIKCIVDAIAGGGGEFGFEFLAIGLPIEFLGGGGEFGGIDIAALGGGEAKGGPIGSGAGVFKAVIKMIAALGRAD